MSLLERTSKYKDMRTIPEIISGSTNQRDIVRKLEEFQPDAENRHVSKFTNPGILCDEAFVDEKVLATSIFLALRSYKNMDSLILVAGDYPQMPKPGIISSSFEETSRNVLAGSIAKQILRNPKAIGFSLGFRVTRDGKPRSYDLQIIEITDGRTREEVRLEGKEELKTKINMFMDGLKGEETPLYGYKEVENERVKLAEEIDWKPKYIARFER